MTKIADVSRIKHFTAIAAQTLFPYSFAIVDSGDITVYVDGIAQVLTTDYTISGVGADAGGNVTFVVPMVGGEAIVLYGDKPVARLTEFDTSQVVLLASELNAQQEAQTIFAQQGERDLVRALRLSAFDTEVSMQLPVAATRKGKYLRFSDASGAPEMADVTASTTILSRSVISNFLWPTLVTEVGVTDEGYKYGDVRRFGAVLDGVTDDWTPLNNAITSNKIAYVPDGNLYIATATTPVGVDEGIVGLGRQSRITYDGTGTCIDIAGNFWRLDQIFIVVEQSNAVGVDVNNFSNGKSDLLRINGRKTEGKTGQIALLIDGDLTGGYWNTFTKHEFRNIGIGAELLNDANSNDFIGGIVRIVDKAYHLNGGATAGFHALNNHIIGGSIDTFDLFAIHIENADYTASIGVYIESTIGGSRPWQVDETVAGYATNNSFVAEFNNVVLGPVDNGTLTMRSGASDGRVQFPKIIGDSLRLSTTDESITAGAGSPEGVKTEVKGSLYIQTDANPDTGGHTLWQKSTTGGNTGWRAIEYSRPRGGKTMVAGTAAVDFTDEGFADEPDASYFLQLSSDTAGDISWSSKTATGFTITHSGGGTEVVDWLVVR